MAFHAIQPNLVQNQTGVEVTSLQAALDKLGWGAPIKQQERVDNKFGEGTADAVQRLQSQFGLAATRPTKVDEQTAELINKMLFESGVFRSVEGRVTTRAGSAVAGNLLFAFDSDNIGGAYLGSANTNKEGAYQFFYDPLLYSLPGEGVLKRKDTIDLVVQVYDAAGKTLAESQPLHDPAQRVQVDLVLADRPADTTFVIRGQVVDASGPQNNIQVSVFDRDLFFRRRGAPAAQQLGSGLTGRRPGKDEEGWFEFVYTPTVFAAGDLSGTNAVPTPDLIFALSKDGQPLEPAEIFRLPDEQELQEEALITADDLILGLQARKVEEVRIRLEGGEARRELSEYERLIQAIEPLLPERAPIDASDEEREALVQEAVQRFDEVNHRDVSFVARETGFAPSAIQALVAAVRLAVDPFRKDLPISVFYGLARMRGVNDLLSLGRLSTAELAAGLREAASQAPPIIPPLEPALSLDAVVKQIRAVLADNLPSYRPIDGSPSLTDLVGHALPDPSDQATLWQTMVDHEGTAEELWAKLRQQPGFSNSSTIANLQFAFDLSSLAQNNLSMINAIRSEFPQITSMRDLAFELDTPDKWGSLLADPNLPIQIPEDIPGKPEERKANYAAILAQAIQIAHPSVAVANMVAVLPETLLGQAQSPVAGFLENAIRTADFNLVDGHIDDLVVKHGEQLLQDVDPDLHGAVIDQVKRLQRVFRLSTGPESMKVLLEAGFHSARELAELPSDVAMEMMAPAMGEDAAALVLNRARNIAAMAIHQYVFLADASNGVLPEVFHGIQ